MHHQRAVPQLPKSTVLLISPIIHDDEHVSYRSVLPLLGICCLGIVGLLVAITIVLALIPLYIPTKRLEVNNATVNSKGF